MQLLEESEPPPTRSTDSPDNRSPSRGISWLGLWPSPWQNASNSYHASDGRGRTRLNTLKGNDITIMQLKQSNRTNYAMLLTYINWWGHLGNTNLINRHCKFHATYLFVLVRGLLQSRHLTITRQETIPSESDKAFSTICSARKSLSVRNLMDNPTWATTLIIGWLERFSFGEFQSHEVFTFPADI